MADKKISALTGASTPLAGTEVLPIVQSGATVKVSVANLTAGRDVSAKDLTTTGNTILGDASTDTLNVGSGDIIKDANGNVGIGQASPYNNAAFKTLAVGGSKVGFVGLYNASNVLQATLDTYNNTFRIGTNGTTNPIIFYLGGTVQETLKLDSSSNTTFTAGNLIQGTAAKGVNFTANTPAAGMTSQLLNWYEEGAFTATAVPDTGTITLSTNTLRYTRTGRTVHISGTLVVGSVSSPTNNVYIATLPFSAGLACGGGIAVDGTNAFAGQVGWFINASQQSLYIYYRDATGAYVASAPIFKAGTVIRIDATYTV